MQGARIYSAPSLAEVIRHLRLYRASGMLSIRPARAVYREQVDITIEYGHPVGIRRGMYEEVASDATLRQLNAWGEIHFTFQSRVRLLSLPAPTHPLPQAQSQLSSHPIKSSQSLANPSVSQALPSISVPTDKIPAVSQGTRSGKMLKAGNGTYHLGYGNVHAVAPETVIPSLTSNAQQYPITKLSHHDRTIFLLINGQRSVADLMALTNRSLADVYNTLYGLRDEQLIVIQQIQPGHT
jgi:hypothetical protein